MFYILKILFIYKTVLRHTVQIQYEVIPSCKVAQNQKFIIISLIRKNLEFFVYSFGRLEYVGHSFAYVSHFL